MHGCWSYAAVSALSLDHDFHKEVAKSWTKLLSISLPPTFRSHPGVAKSHTIWDTFSRYFLLDTFSLACGIQIVSGYVRHHSHFLEN